MPTILIVDDEPVTLQVIESFLSEQEYKLETVDGGQKALDLLLGEPENYDLVLLDRWMPDVDGIEVMRQIKSHSRLKNLPVIMQTAAKSEEDVVTGLEAGVNYYLTKPYSQRVLRPIIRTALEDRERWTKLQEKLKQSVRVSGLMRNGNFQFQSINEAEQLAVFLSNACPDPGRVITGLTEIFINSVEHGNLGIEYDDKSRLIQNEEWASEVERRLSLPENRKKYVRVLFQNFDRFIKLNVKDEGKGFDWHPFLEIDADRAFDSHGRGIAMARLLSFDSMEYLGNGNEVDIRINS
jgi:DNA-binding response OmpR family regulator